MTDRRPSNSELRLQQLQQLEAEEQEAREERGILELFDDSDEPLSRDDDRQPKR